MLMKSVARRYAAAFFKLASEAGQLDEMENQLQIVVDALAANRELKKVFYHKMIKEKDKKEVVKAVFEGRIQPTTMNFLFLLIDKQRENYLELVFQQYVLFANQARNIMDAGVVSAIELSPADVKDLQARLSTITGKNVRLRTEVDPKILGGLVVRVGDRVIDGSVTKRLQMLKSNMIKAQLRLS
ncbi:MAG: F0F1 ATP synthase subunit delta [Firmicutes bacterium]|nr:F0F1 ATP synthase subunit delta [Bacillota bacterium]